MVFYQQRHQSDNEVNNKESMVLRDGEFQSERWQNVIVGDIIRMKDDEFVAVSSNLSTQCKDLRL